MGFIKVVKNKPYFKRFQVKKRRRREGKTDFQARTAMVKQNKNKYNAPRYRLVVRHTNRKVVCQIVHATIAGDKVMCQALSSELPQYGIKAGLTNYSATYATGLLVARRLLKQLGLEDSFEGVDEADGEEFHVEEEVDEDERRPFKAILDIGLVRTTVGAKVFAAMKGAADGGLHVPHNCKRFPGYSAPEEAGQEAAFEAGVLAGRIHGEHVAEYMEAREEEDEEKYKAQFAEYLKNGITHENLEDMYKDAHKAIRESPEHKPKDKKAVKITRKGNKIFDGKNTYNRDIKRTKSEKQARVATKIANHAKKVLAQMEADSDEE